MALVVFRKASMAFGRGQKAHTRTTISFRSRELCHFGGSGRGLPIPSCRTFLNPLHAFALISARSAKQAPTRPCEQVREQPWAVAGPDFDESDARQVHCPSFAILHTPSSRHASAKRQRVPTIPLLRHGPAEASYSTVQPQSDNMKIVLHFWPPAHPSLQLCPEFKGVPQTSNLFADCQFNDHWSVQTQGFAHWVHLEA